MFKHHFEKKEKLQYEGDKQYYPVTLVKMYSFDELPDEDVFIKECSHEEEEEEKEDIY